LAARDTVEISNPVRYKGDVPELRISPSFMEILHQVDTGRAKMSRPERELISFQKERTLQINNSLHDSGQRTPTLFHSLDKALCFFYLLAGILQNFPFRRLILARPVSTW